jgi:hypothetical protein
MIFKGNPSFAQLSTKCAGYNCPLMGYETARSWLRVLFQTIATQGRL